MIKGLTRLWLLGAKRIAKAQKAQNKKLIKVLFAKPPAVKSPRRRPAAPAAAATATVATKRTQAAAKPAIRAAARLPGKWMASYYSSLADGASPPGRRMSYWLYLPAKVVSGPLPLVVMLHGCEQTAVRFSEGTRMNRLAEQKGFAVLYPQQSLRGHPNRCWHWYEKPTQDGGGDVQLIVGIIGQVVDKYAMDRSRIYIAGLSAGASMAGIVALNFPNLIAAVGLHSGTVFGAGRSRMDAYAIMQTGAAGKIGGPIRDVLEKSGAFPGMPAILIHGQSDKVVRPINLTQLAQQFRLLNRLSGDGEPPPVLKLAAKPGARNPANAYKTIDHYSGRKLMLRVCDILQLDHAWSGGDCKLQYNACAGPDASKMMWDFFARHRRSA